MIKKTNNKSIKLIKFYNFINYNLIYNNKAINRYKKDVFQISGKKADKLDKLKKSINNIKNCEFKKNARPEEVTTTCSRYTLYSIPYMYMY